MLLGGCGGSQDEIAKAEQLVERKAKTELEQRDVTWDAHPTATCERKSEHRLACFATTMISMTDDGLCGTIESEHEIRVDRKNRMSERTIRVDEPDINERC